MNKKRRKIFWLLGIVLIVFFAILFVFSKYYLHEGRFYAKKMPQMADIVLVEQPFVKKNNIKITRCIAKAGQTVQIINSIIWVDNKPIDENYNVIKKYRINCFSIEANKKLLNYYKFVDSADILGVYKVDLNQKQAADLQNDSLFITKQIIAKSGNGNTKLFPQTYLYRWNEDNFGPLFIPHKGYKIKLDKENFSLYKNIIHFFENKDIKKEEGTYFIDNQKVTEYVFEQDYYFVLNDNRTDLVDSRMWGVIPQRAIKATKSR